MDQEVVKPLHELHTLGMNNDLLDRVRGSGSEIGIRCELVELLVRHAPP